MGRRITGTLDLHGAHYRVRVQVPRRLRDCFGGQHSLIQMLPTDSKAHAIRMKAGIVSAMLDQIRQVQRQLINAEHSTPIDVPMDFANRVREQIGAYIDQFHNFGDDTITSARVYLGSEAKLSPLRSRAFSDLALGKATSIETLIPTYLNESARKPRDKADCERALKKMIAFMVKMNMPTTVEHLTRPMVGEWRSERVRLGHHWKTINKDLSLCSSLFIYSIRQGLVHDNPFLQSLPKIKAKTKRAYTKPEMRVLLRGGGDVWLIESIVVLALSGMRAGELANLQVQNCQSGVFQLLETKGEKNRNVPIHSKLLKLVRKRCLNKKPDEYLFHEIPTPSNPKIERSQFLTKHFLRYRRRLGLDEQNGGRQSAIDLHSLRRYFATQADTAGHRLEDIERVMGHRPQSLSLGLYADPLSIRQMRRVVESVRLPS